MGGGGGGAAAPPPLPPPLLSPPSPAVFAGGEGGGGEGGGGEGGEKVSSGAAGGDDADARSKAIRRSASLLRAAAAEDDEEKELSSLRSALAIRRRLCHPLSAARYEAECQALTCALAVGELPEALESCRNAVRFLEMALAHVPNHPLLALQRFTLGDLELACAEQNLGESPAPGSAVTDGAMDHGANGGQSGGGGGGNGGSSAGVLVCSDCDAREVRKDGRVAALAVMLQCAMAIEVSSASNSALRATAKERLEDMRALVPSESKDVEARPEVLC